MRVARPHGAEGREKRGERPLTCRMGGDLRRRLQLRVHEHDRLAFGTSGGTVTSGRAGEARTAAQRARAPLPAVRPSRNDIGDHARGRRTRSASASACSATARKAGDAQRVTRHRGVPRLFFPCALLTLPSRRPSLLGPVSRQRARHAGCSQGRSCLHGTRTRTSTDPSGSSGAGR